MNRFIQTHHENKEPDSYDEYMNSRILPLETALAPVLSHVNQLDHYTNLAKSQCHRFSVCKLTEDESAAVYLYTRNWGKQSLHHLLNRALNSGNYTQMRPWFGFLKLFITALEKLPTVKGIIWRGLHNDIAKDLREGDKITWWSLSSCSLSVSIIRCLLDESSTLCSIEALNGKRIGVFAYDTTEDEILLLPGTRLCVMNKKLDPSSGQQTVYLKEISNDSPKTPTSTPSSISPTSKSSKHELRPDNSTTSYVSTAYMMMENPLSNKDEPRDDTVFSVTTFGNGDRYEVGYKNGKKQGHGVYFYDNEKIEEGSRADYRATGIGTRTWQNGDRYEGNFRSGEMNGFGTLYYGNGYVYEGNWIADEPYAEGKTTWPNGTRCKGFHENGKIHGYGIFDSINGDRYQGYLVDGKAHGEGSRIWPNSDRYDGNFKDDKKHGSGTYFYANGGKYTGNWIDDEMNGRGVYKWPSTTRYEGMFKNGKKHGQGTLTFANGQVQSGCWENDKYIG